MQGWLVGAQLDVSQPEWCQALGRNQRWSGAGRGCPGVLAPLGRASGLGDSQCSCLVLVPHRSMGTVWVYVGQGQDLALCGQDLALCSQGSVPGRCHLGLAWGRAQQVHEGST